MNALCTVLLLITTFDPDFGWKKMPVGPDRKTLPKRDLPPKVEPKDYSGFYEVRGTERTDEKTRSYVGLLMLKRISDDQYAAQWTSGIGQNAVGFGILKENTLTFSWIIGGLQGVTEYTMSDRKRHKGRWYHSKNPTWCDESIEFKLPLFQPPPENNDAKNQVDPPSNQLRLSQRRLSQGSEGAVQNLGVSKR